MGSRPIIRPIFLHGGMTVPVMRVPTVPVGKVLGMTYKNVLVMAREHLGDLVNITGGLHAVAREWPDARFTVEAGEGAIQILEGWRAGSKLWPRPRHQGFSGKLRFALKARQARFDLGIIFDDSNVHIALLKLAGVPNRYGVFKSKHRPWFKDWVPADGHDTFGWLGPLLEKLGIEGPDLSPRLNLPDIEFPEGLIGLALGASTREKQWPLSRFRSLVDLHPGPFITFAGPRESHLRLPGVPHAEDLGHPLQLATAISKCRALVTADSGPAHLAAAVKTPAVVLYGPTDPARFAPFGKNHVLLRNQEGCDWNRRLCLHKATPGCTQTCMSTISAQDVAQALAKLSV